MNENKETNDTIDDQFNPEQGIHLENRQEPDRRSDSSKGFAYITTGLIPTKVQKLSYKFR